MSCYHMSGYHLNRGMVGGLPSKFGLVLLFELRCLLFVILFLCVKLLLKLSVLG